MIIYGTSAAKHLRTEALPLGPACPNCGQPGGLRSGVYGRYAHVYWIPLFPASKLVFTECTHCGQVWDAQALPAPLQAPVLALRRETKAPAFHWTGAALLAGAGLVGLFFYAKDERANKAYLDRPRVGDVYTVRVPDADSTKTGPGPNYSLMKVRGVSGNSVELVGNEYQINNSHPLHELDKPENYGQEPVYLTRYDLQLMQQKGELTDVDRGGETVNE